MVYVNPTSIEVSITNMNHFKYKFSEKYSTNPAFRANIKETILVSDNACIKDYSNSLRYYGGLY